MKKEYDIFLSGPMSLHEDFNHPLFHEAAAALRKMGYTVFSPAEIDGGGVDKPRTYYLRVCFVALTRCKALVSLPRWSRSDGAWLERQMAKQLDMPTWNLSTFLKDHG